MESVQSSGRKEDKIFAIKVHKRTKVMIFVIYYHANHDMLKNYSYFILK